MKPELPANKLESFKNRGLLGYVLAALFLLAMFVMLTSPIWLIALGVYVVGNIID